MKTSIAKTLPCFALSLFAAACGQPGDEPQDVSSDEVAQTASTLCTDPGAANYSKPMALLGGSGTVAALSPAGHPNTPACSDGYVVEATGLFGMNHLYASAGGDYPTTAGDATCEQLVAYMDVYARPPGASAWVQFVDGAHKAATLTKLADGSYVCRTWINFALPPWPADQMRVVVRAQYFLQFPSVWGIIRKLPG